MTPDNKDFIDSLKSLKQDVHIIKNLEKFGFVSIDKNEENHFTLTESKLPVFLSEHLKNAKTLVKIDILLLADLTVIGACFPNVYFSYNESERYHPSIYTTITTPSGVGKSVVAKALNLLLPIKQRYEELTAENLKRWKQKKAEYAKVEKENITEKQWYDSIEIQIKNQLANQNLTDFEINNQIAKAKESAPYPKEPEAKEPKHYGLQIASDANQASFFKGLDNVFSNGLIVAQEAASFFNSLSEENKHGGFSSGVRRAAQHELIDRGRAGEGAKIQIIERPRLSILATGTLPQTEVIFTDNALKNGDNSRYLVYYYKATAEDLKWKGIKKVKRKSLPKIEEIDPLAYELDLMAEIAETADIEIFFDNEEIIEMHNEFFPHLSQIAIDEMGADARQAINRYGYLVLRIAAILTIISTGKDQLNNSEGGLECTVDNFKIALIIVKTCALQFMKQFQDASYNQVVEKPRQISKLLENLPQVFSYSQGYQKAMEIGIIEMTYSRYLKKLGEQSLLVKEGEGKNTLYTKLIDKNLVTDKAKIKDKNTKNKKK